MRFFLEFIDVAIRKQMFRSALLVDNFDCDVSEPPRNLNVNGQLGFITEVGFGLLKGPIEKLVGFAVLAFSYERVGLREDDR